MLPLAALADYQAGLDAYSAGDYAKAMREWRDVTDGPPTATSPGEFVESHYAVAMLYWEGQGVQQSYLQAYHWLLRAANMNHAGAQAKLGFLYTDGTGVAQDYAQAFTWFSRAAKAGNVDGLYNLGIFYFYGWGVEQDKTMAAQYLAAASAQGDAQAEEALQQVLAQIDQEQGADPPELEALPEVTAAEPEPLAEPEAVADAPAIAPEPGSELDEPLPAEAAPAQPSAAPEDPLVLGEDWIRAQNPEHFTIQVMALGSRAKVADFTRTYEAFAPFAVFTVQKGTAPLHVMLQGSYSELEAARAAKARFPAEIQRQDALWIRRFSAVQALLE